MTTNIGVQSFYYTAELPSRSVAIAQVHTTPTSPAQLTDLVNTPYQQGDLSIRKAITPDTSPADFIAPDYMQAVRISGSTAYRLYNQFFEITNVLLSDNNPGFYVHILPSNVDQQIVIVDLKGNTVSTPTSRSGNFLYHTLDGATYRIRYIDPQGYLHLDLLQYNPAIAINAHAASASNYVLNGRDLTLSSSGDYWVRFIKSNGYQAVVPYNAQPNTPWFARIRFGLTPSAPEWALQNWMPRRPYLLATWVPGVIIDSSIIEFERKQIYYDPANLPTILVFDKNYVIKYALDGSLPGSPARRGTLYNWQRGLIQFVDPYKGRVQVVVALDPTDIAFAFYSYVEPDIIYMNLDVNPFTNAAVKNKIVQFYFKDNGDNPLNYIYHQILDSTGSPIVGQTNDPNPSSGTNVIFSYLAIGVGISAKQFTITDIRQRGGGLTSAYQNIPQAVNFWDLGFWDGKPYPIGGTLAVYVPASVLTKLSNSDILGAVRASLPAGCLPVIRFYNPDGTEFIGGTNIE